MNKLYINQNFSIPDSEFSWSYVRSSGPGGQNVNRTNSCVVLRWNFLESPSFQQAPKAQIVIERITDLATKDGDIIIKSQTFRDQAQNYKECKDRLVQILQKAFFIPKFRVATAPTKSSKRRRLTTKKLTGEKKTQRKKPSFSHGE